MKMRTPNIKNKTLYLDKQRLSFEMKDTNHKTGLN